MLYTLLPFDTFKITIQTELYKNKSKRLKGLRWDKRPHSRPHTYSTSPYNTPIHPSLQRTMQFNETVYGFRQ